jgi:hypothetical protein
MIRIAAEYFNGIAILQPDQSWTGCVRLEFVDASRTFDHRNTKTLCKANRTVPLAYTQRTAALMYTDYNQHGSLDSLCVRTKVSQQLFRGHRRALPALGQQSRRC